MKIKHDRTSKDWWKAHRSGLYPLITERCVSKGAEYVGESIYGEGDCHTSLIVCVLALEAS